VGCPALGTLMGLTYCAGREDDEFVSDAVDEAEASLRQVLVER
jgi:hypothetical protein